MSHLTSAHSGWSTWERMKRKVNHQEESEAETSVFSYCGTRSKPTASYIWPTMQQIAFLPAVHLSVKFKTPSNCDVPGITNCSQRRRIAGHYTTALTFRAALQKYLGVFFECQHVGGAHVRTNTRSTTMKKIINLWLKNSNVLPTEMTKMFWHLDEDTGSDWVIIFRVFCLSDAVVEGNDNSAVWRVLCWRAMFGWWYIGLPLMQGVGMI